MNETRLIDWLTRRLRSGLGDDAAIVAHNRKWDWLITSDMLIEKVHFDHRASLADRGRKSMMSNVSDIAAMGGIPRYALVSMGLERAMTLAKAKEVYGGLIAVCKAYGIQIIGGDTCRSERQTISITLIGEVERGRALLRSGARVGDILFSTGPMGRSLPSGRHLSFKARVRESRFLVSRYQVNAMIDVSDGLSKDLGHLARASRVGLRVYEASLPLNHRATWRDAFLDGEDFELIFTVTPQEAARLLKDRRAIRMGFVFYPLGCVVAARRGLKLVDLEGREKSFPKYHDHHFKT